MQDKMATDEEINDRFHYHAPSEKGIGTHAALSAAYSQLGRMVNDLIPNGREKSLAMTHLEESKMWASAAVARNPRTR